MVESTDAPIAGIAQQLGIERGMLRRGVEAARPSPREPVTEDERSELTRLRRESLQLKMVRDILRKPRPSSPARASEVRLHRARIGGSAPCVRYS